MGIDQVPGILSFVGLTGIIISLFVQRHGGNLRIKNANTTV